MLHVVCDCGALVTPALPIGAGAVVPCRSCRAPVPVPDLGPQGDLPSGSPSPGSPPGAAAPDPGAPARRPALVFESDARLDLLALEAQVLRLRLLGRLAVLAGFAGAGVGAWLAGPEPGRRAVVASGVLLAGILIASACSAARRATLATLALASRQRELARALTRD